MDEQTDDCGDLSAVPLFPLPNVVLFPRAVLPLHVFEERYKVMTTHALAGDRLIAMALLKPGWEKNYYARPPIEPAVCVGRILTYEHLPNGEFNFLLQGVWRACVTCESPAAPFRTARLQPQVEIPALDLDLEEQRARLTNLLEQSFLMTTGVGLQFRRILSSPMATADIADLIAFNFLDDVALKQSLLAEPDVRRRVDRLVDAFETACLAAAPAYDLAHDSSLN